jgi:hypothetical protein
VWNVIIFISVTEFFSFVIWMAVFCVIILLANNCHSCCHLCRNIFKGFLNSMKVVLNFVWGSMCHRLSLEVAFVLYYRFRISFCGGGGWGWGEEGLETTWCSMK